MFDQPVAVTSEPRAAVALVSGPVRGLISSEGDSTWTRLNTNAAEGKAKAAARLLKQLIPDVEAYIHKNRSPTGPAGVDRGT